MRSSASMHCSISAADGILILHADHTVERCNTAFEKLSGKVREEVVGKHHSEIIQWAKEPQGTTLEEAEREGWPLTPNATLYVEGDLKRPLLPPLPVGVSYAPLLAEEGTHWPPHQTNGCGTSWRRCATSRTSVRRRRSNPPLFPSSVTNCGRQWHSSKDMHPRCAAMMPSGIEKSSAKAWPSSKKKPTDCRAMIDDLLDASRLQAGGISLNRADVSLPALASRVAERFTTQSKKHTIATDFPDKFPVILADEPRIEQVIANLVSNSLKYAPKGEIKISGSVRPEQVVVCVSDEGPGIEAKDLPHIFDRFYRSTNAVKQTKGAGLGLYLARAIIEAHGGRIWPDPKPDSGARICFSLPR